MHSSFSVCPCSAIPSFSFFSSLSDLFGLFLAVDIEEFALTLTARFMDKFFSIFTFPIGLVICFAPALIVWLKAELKDSPPKDKKD